MLSPEATTEAVLFLIEHQLATGDFTVEQRVTLMDLRDKIEAERPPLNKLNQALETLQRPFFS